MKENRMLHRNLVLLAVVLGFGGRALTAQSPKGWITITGGEKSSGAVWDAGTVTVKINGYSVSIPYGQFSTPASIASALAALISQNCNAPAYAKASGATVNFYPKGSTVINTASITGATGDPSLFSSSSFQSDGSAQNSCFVPAPTYYVQYRAFIPADHLLTAVPCYFEQAQASPVPDINVPPFNVPLGAIIVLGDASSFSTHFRIKQYTNLSFSPSGPGSESSVVPVPSVSYNFVYPHVKGNVTANDFNPKTLLECIYPEQNTGSASMANEVGTASSTGANQASVNFCCSATDPLFKNPVAPIQYNLSVSINEATDPPQATITGSHTCFPSHEIVIGKQVVYQRNPSPVNFAELSYCLIGAQVGLTETKVSCTVPLDGVSKCP
jgi:hypothetical protein